LSNCEFLLRIDNTTAIAYINRFGSVKYPLLSSLSKAIWQWCEARNIWLVASYIASAINVIADEESRRIDADTEWSLSKEAFRLIDRRLGPFDIFLLQTLTRSVMSLSPGFQIRSLLQLMRLLSTGENFISMHFLLSSYFPGFCERLLMTRRRGL